MGAMKVLGRLEIPDPPPGLSTPLNEFKAKILIRGMSDQAAYARTREKVIKSATRKLTHCAPGHMSCYPDLIVLFQKRFYPEGKRTLWVMIDKIPFESIPETEHEWRKRVRSVTLRRNRGEED